jgi:MFS family permease
MSRRRAALLLFFLSGSVLVLEILAARLLAPYVGLSLETYTAIIGVVLAGIAVGHGIGGRIADRAPWRPALSLLVLTGGLSSAVIVPIVSTFGADLSEPSVAAGVVLALAGFFAPTAALSAASPVVTKAQLVDWEHSGRVVGSLSAWSTAGALTGTFVTGFVLVTTFPTTRIIYAVAVLLVALGAGLALAPLRARGAAAGVVLLIGGFGAATAGSPCQVETRYYCASVRAAPDVPTGRILRLDTLSHSYVDLADPTRLGFRYQRVAAAALKARFGPTAAVDVLHLGGGGFAFPRFVAETRPGSANRWRSGSSSKTRLAEEQLDLDPNLVHVDTGDARPAVAGVPDRSLDAIVADTFGSLDPPWHLATREAVEQVRRTLREDGIYIVDVVDSGSLSFVRAEAATLRRTFAHVIAVRAPVGESPANTVLIAADKPLSLSLSAEDGRVLSEEETARFAGEAIVLRDDFAPVQRLVTRAR